MSSSGRLRGSSPWSPTFGNGDSPNTTTAAVSSTIAMSGAGTARVIRGQTNRMPSPTTTSTYTAHGTSISCGTCDRKMRIASALTNPTITLRGMKRMSFATPSTANSTWMTPASTIVTMR